MSATSSRFSRTAPNTLVNSCNTCTSPRNALVDIIFNHDYGRNTPALCNFVAMYTAGAHVTVNAMTTLLLMAIIHAAYHCGSS